MVLRAAEGMGGLFGMTGGVVLSMIMKFFSCAAVSGLSGMRTLTRQRMCKSCSLKNAKHRKQAEKILSGKCLSLLKAIPSCH